MTISRIADGSGGWQILNRDQYKSTEYVAADVTDAHFRNSNYQESQCICGAKYSYRQYCGNYATRDQNAWMRSLAGGAEIKLSEITEITGIDQYEHMREGKCRPCVMCSEGEYNGGCKLGKEGVCNTCKLQTECTPTQYLHHNNLKGCVQTRALSDYVCTECHMWDIIDDKYVLLVGCGVRDLNRWHPQARKGADDKLEMITCLFEGGSGLIDDPCMHNGIALLQKKPFGNFSSTIPYCAPGWHVSPDLASRSKLDAFDPKYCIQCVDCKAEQKKTPGWQKCPGGTVTDTQGTFCTERCENNMYEEDETCVYCKTCKEGEI